MPSRLRAVASAERAGRLALAALVLASAAFALSHLGGLRWDSDEGINLAKAWLIADGFGLYREIWADQPPGYTLLLGMLFRTLGPSLSAARGLSAVLGLAGLLGVALGARELILARGRTAAAAWTGALAAALALALAPNFWWASRAAMIGLPAFAWAALAMGLFLAYVREGSRKHLIGAALGLGLSLWLKLQMIYLGLPLGLMLLWRHLGRQPAPRKAEGRAQGPDSKIDSEQPSALPHRARALVADLAILGFGSLGPLLLSAWAYGPRVFYDQAFGTYLDTRASYAVDFAANLGVLRTWLLADNLGLALLAAAGALILLRRPGPTGVLALTWTGLTLVTALQHAPLWIKDHFEPLMFALATLAGLAVGELVAAWPGRSSAGDPAPLGDASAHDQAGKRRRASGPRRLGWPGRLALLGCLAWLAWLPHVLAVDVSLAAARSYDNDGDIVRRGSEAWLSEQRRDDELRAAAAYLAAHSGPEDFVATDYQLVAFLAGRRVAPGLAAFSSRAVGVGAFSGADLIRATEDFDVPVVLMWDEAIAGFPDYVAYLGEDRGGAPRFRLDIDLGKDRLGWLRADRLASDAAQGPVFDDLARLLGHAASRSGRQIDLRLFWQTLGRSRAQLSVFSHVYGPDGERYGQHDGTPAEGGQPTTEWPVPGLVIDRHLIELDERMPEGSRLHVGIYDPDTGARLPLRVDGLRIEGDTLVLPEPLDLEGNTP